MVDRHRRSAPSLPDLTAMPNPTSYEDALARLREVFASFHKSPGVLVNSLELEDCTRDVTRAALSGSVPFPALCAEFGRAATESLQDDRLIAIRVARAMTKWAADVYRRHARLAEYPGAPV